MPVTYTVSNVGQNYEPPPPRSRPEPGYYEPVNKSPHQNQNYYGPINRGPHNQDQGYYEPVYRGPYQDQGYYGPTNRASHQDQGYYRPTNRGYYPDHQTYYEPIKRSPYQDNEPYKGPTNRIPYYKDSGYESDMSDNYHYHHGYVDPYKSPGTQPYIGASHGLNTLVREQSQISDIIEWKESPEAHVYKAYLPGVKRGDVEVEVEEEEDIGMVLNIKFYKGVEYSGQRVQEVHSIMLPHNANTGQVKANMENGVLTVMLPKLTRSVKAYRMSTY